MDFEDSQQERHFREAWSAVEIVRPVSYGLFTFGESVLSYYLVCGERESATPVSVRQGDVRIKRPMIITPDSARPEFQGFFENTDEEGIAQFLLARTAQFSNLHFLNQSGAQRTVSDSVAVTVDKLNRKLDDEDEDRVAILTSPPNLAGIAVLRYTAERVLESAPQNIQELKERGFLP